MFSKQQGALHLPIIATILAATVLAGLVAIYFLDKAVMDRTVLQNKSSRVELVQPVLAGDDTQAKPSLGAVKTQQEKLERSLGTTDPTSESENTLPAAQEIELSTKGTIKRSVDSN